MTEVPRSLELQNLLVVLGPTKTTALIQLIHTHGRTEFTASINKLEEMRDALDRAIRMSHPQ